ncbi:MAG: ribonuclease Z, partial [Promethearchaeota archaeon]
MELIILGSSAAIPIKNRNLSSIALRIERVPETVLFDCGEDVQRRFIEAGLKLNKPLKILISHFHGDHINGLPGLLFRFNLIERTAPLTIIGPKNIFFYLFFHGLTVGLRARYPITVIEIDYVEKEKKIYKGLESWTPVVREKIENGNMILETDKYLINYAVVEHSVLTYAYSLVEKPRNGKFNPKRALELGIPQNYLWKRLHEGKKINFNGKTIDPEKEGIVGPKRPGRKITYSGDTTPCNSLISLGMNSDVLIHEATFSQDLAQVALEKKHSTSIDAANAALKMNAKKLIITHISSRYQDDPSILLKEAQNIFQNTI